MKSIAKRKTTTSSEVKTRWNKKTYVQYNVNFRKVEDADIIAKIESLKAEGINTTEAFRQLITNK